MHWNYFTANLVRTLIRSMKSENDVHFVLHCVKCNISVTYFNNVTRSKCSVPWPKLLKCITWSRERWDFDINKYFILSVLRVQIFWFVKYFRCHGDPKNRWLLSLSNHVRCIFSQMDTEEKLFGFSSLLCFPYETKHNWEKNAVEKVVDFF